MTTLVLSAGVFGNSSLAWLSPAFAVISSAYTISDSTSCTALPLTIGTATWDGTNNTCTLPIGSDLEVCCEFGALNVVSGVTLVNRGDMSFQEETRMTVAGVLDNYGTLFNKNAFVTVDGIINNYGELGGVPAGQYNIHAGAQLNNFNTARLPAFNQGTLVNNVGASLYTFTSIENGVGGVLTNFGTLNVVDASVLFNSGTIHNHGTITIEEGSFTNGGVLNNLGGATIDNFADMVNAATGTLNNNNGATIINNSVCGGICPIIKNFGTIHNKGSIVNDSTGGINNTGDFIISCNGTVTGDGPVNGNPFIFEACDDFGVIADATNQATGQSMFAGGRTFYGEQFNPEAAIVSKVVDCATVELRRHDAPTGMAEVGFYDSSMNLVKLFGTIDVSTLTTGYKQYEFCLPESDAGHQIQSDQILAVKYTSGDSVNRIDVRRSNIGSGPEYDGLAAYHVNFDTIWHIYNAEGNSRDLLFKLSNS